jgi:hypothetical protein
MERHSGDRCLVAAAYQPLLLAGGDVEHLDNGVVGDGKVPAVGGESELAALPQEQHGVFPNQPLLPRPSVPDLQRPVRAQSRQQRALARRAEGNGVGIRGR